MGNVGRDSCRIPTSRELPEDSRKRGAPSPSRRDPPMPGIDPLRSFEMVPNSTRLYVNPSVFSGPATDSAQRRVLRLPASKSVYRLKDSLVDLVVDRVKGDPQRYRDAPRLRGRPSVRELDVLVEHYGALLVADDVVAVQTVAEFVEVIFPLGALVALGGEDRGADLVGVGRAGLVDGG